MLQNESKVLNIPVPKMRLYVRIQNRTILMDVQLKDSVRDVKRKIQDLEGIPWASQRLVHANWKGESFVLEDKLALKDYKLDDCSLVHVLPPDMEKERYLRSSRKAHF